MYRYVYTYVCVSMYISNIYIDIYKEPTEYNSKPSIHLNPWY